MLLFLVSQCPVADYTTLIQLFVASDLFTFNEVKYTQFAGDMILGENDFIDYVGSISSFSNPTLWR